MKKTPTKELKKFKRKFTIMILVLDALAVVLSYFIMPLVQNFPPLSEDFAFQREVQQFTHIQQYTIVYIVGVLVHLFSFTALMQRIYKYLNKYYRKENIRYEEIQKVRKDCINIPYKVFFVQTILIVSIGILFNFIMLASKLAIIRFTLMIIALASIISIILLIGTQKILYKVNLTTYEITNKYEEHNGFRITNSQNLLFQMVPFIAVILIVVSLIGYSKAVQQKGFATGNYYKAYIETKDIQQSEVNMDKLKKILNTIPLQDSSNYYYIISPEDKDIYVSNPKGSISDFVLSYRNYFLKGTEGFLYEKFGVDEQLYTKQLKDDAGNIWYIGFKYPVVDLDLLVYYFRLIIIVLIVYSILLYIWSRNISTNLIRTTNSLKNILDEENIMKNRMLPLASNDEFSDLAYYYNKIQEQTIKNIEKIHDNQDTLMEKERLASLGQLIGGIAHNLKTPIMSISGATEGLKDLVKEYDLSIGDEEVTQEDHHEIAKDMNKWIAKIKTHTEYMSDVITAVKGQAVTLANDEDITFTIEELLKRVDILMKHELKNAIIFLKVEMNTDSNILLKGDVNSLVQVINNMISNSIQAYEGKKEQTIELIVNKKQDNLIIKVKDYASGMSDEVKEKLFKEMITTKGKNGTGLGLYMSYSTIKAHFNGNIVVESEKGKGTEFTITLPIYKKLNK